MLKLINSIKLCKNKDMKQLKTINTVVIYQKRYTLFSCVGLVHIIRLSKISHLKSFHEGTDRNIKPPLRT